MNCALNQSERFADKIINDKNRKRAKDRLLDYMINIEEEADFYKAKSNGCFK